MNQKGILTGVGIGPGDPELLTLKAVRMIREAEVIAVPGEHREQTAAYQIAVQAVPEMAEKPFLELSWPMSRDPQVLKECHERAARSIAELLDEGKSVVFLTLGDVTVYSTYLYVHELLQEWGYEVQIVSGVPSFCAAAARMNTSLVMGEEELHVIPASYQIGDAVTLPGTKVFMKAGRRMSQVKEVLRSAGTHAVMVENCGMPGEKLYASLDEIPDNAGYYSLIIVKEQ